MSAQQQCYRQGNLDNLCGVYATVNAIEHMLQGHQVTLNAQELFNEICKNLQKKGRLARMIQEGIGDHELTCSVVDFARAYVKQQHGITVKKTVVSTCAIPLANFWYVIESHTRQYGPGSVLLGLEGTRGDHWTCVKRVTRNQIILLDSDNLHRLHRKDCTTYSPNNRRHHKLCADETWRLTI